MLTWLVLENVCNSLGNNDSFYENVKNTLRFKRNWWESLDEKHEKGVTTTHNYAGNLIVLLGFYIFVVDSRMYDDDPLGVEGDSAGAEVRDGAVSRDHAHPQHVLRPAADCR